MSNDIKEIVLTYLDKAQFNCISWVLDLLCLSFVKDKHEYQLHIQCLTRLKKDKKIIASTNNLCYSQDDDESEVFSKAVSNHLKKYTANQVCDVSISICGDMYFSFGNGVEMEIIVDSSVDDNEQWRFLEVDANKEHIVCYPNLLCCEY